MTFDLVHRGWFWREERVGAAAFRRARETIQKTNVRTIDFFVNSYAGFCFFLVLWEVKGWVPGGEGEVVEPRETTGGKVRGNQKGERGGGGRGKENRGRCMEEETL